MSQAHKLFGPLQSRLQHVAIRCLAGRAAKHAQEMATANSHADVGWWCRDRERGAQVMHLSMGTVRWRGWGFPVLLPPTPRLGEPQFWRAPYFVSLHLSDPAPFTWQSQGRQGKKIIEPGSIIVVSRGTEDWVSFPSPVKRILLNVEPGVFQKAFPDEDPDRDVELVSQWGIHDRHVEFVLRVERTEKPSKGGHPAAATKRSEYIFKLLLS
jgi:hypothetical protein